MIKIEKKNKWAVDLSLHIPIPSFSIAITGVEQEALENVELRHNRSADAAGKNVENVENGLNGENSKNSDSENSKGTSPDEAAGR